MPSCGFFCISRTTSAPASPAPATSTRLADCAARRSVGVAARTARRAAASTAGCRRRRPASAASRWPASSAGRTGPRRACTPNGDDERQRHAAGRDRPGRHQQVADAGVAPVAAGTAPKREEDDRLRRRGRRRARRGRPEREIGRPLEEPVETQHERPEHAQGDGAEIGEQNVAVTHGDEPTNLILARHQRVAAATAAICRASSSITVSWASAPSAVKNGSAMVRSAICSVAGKSPGPQPRSSLM